MNPVDTPKVDNSQYKKTPDGKIDLDAYVGLDATIESNGLCIDAKIVSARMRYGHLDLQVTPKAGTGTRWIEYKNLTIVENKNHLENIRRIGGPAPTIDPQMAPILLEYYGN